MRLAPLAALVAGILLLAAPASADDDSYLPVDCPSSLESGPLRLTAFAVKPPGGEWRDATDLLCVQMQPQQIEGAGFSDPTGHDVLVFTRGYGQDLGRVVPPRSMVSLEFESTGPPPILTVGTLRDPVARYEDNRVAVQGKTGEVRFARKYDRNGPNCSGPVDVMDSFLYVSVMLDSQVGTAFGADYAGSYWGTNAFSYTFPHASWGGKGVELTLWGCGDGDPDTLDGFFQGFLSNAALARMGLDEDLLDAVPDPVVGELMELVDNGDLAPEAEFELGEPRLRRAPGISLPLSGGGDGMAIDYELSFSRHQLVTRGSRKGIKTARRCGRSAGKLKVGGKGKRKQLVCKNRKRR